jgi:hypothetical protein
MKGNGNGNGRISADWPLLPPLTAALALTVFLLTLPPDLTWSHAGGDGGELITAAATLGVPHPPGYPLYVVLGHLFTWLPLGTVAWRLHLFSAVCTAAAVGLLTATLSRPPVTLPHQRHLRSSASLLHPLVAPAAALAVAWAPLVWSQAIIAEVYALNLLLVSGVVWAVFRPIRPFPLGFLWGMALTTHLTSLLLAPLVGWAVWRHGRGWGHAPAGVVAGLWPLALLPWLARSGSPVIWGDPTTWAGWWWLVSGALYRPNLLTPPGTEKLLAWFVLLLRQFSVVGWLLLWPAMRQRRPGTLPALLSLAAFILYSLTWATFDAEVTLLPALLLAGWLIGSGVSASGRRAAVWLLWLLPLSALALNWQATSLHGEPGVQPAVQTLWAQLPHDAVVITPGDNTIFALWYFHHVAGQRPDLILVDDSLFQFGWYRERLRAAHPALHVPPDDVIGEVAVVGENRPICHATLLPAPSATCP